MGARSKQELVEDGKHVPSVPRVAANWSFAVVFAAGFGSGLYFGFPWQGSLFAGAIVGVMVWGWLINVTQFTQPVYRTVTETVEIGRSKSCISCRQAVEHMG